MSAVIARQVTTCSIQGSNQGTAQVMEHPKRQHGHACPNEESASSKDRGGHPEAPDRVCPGSILKFSPAWSDIELTSRKAKRACRTPSCGFYEAD